MSGFEALWEAGRKRTIDEIQTEGPTERQAIAAAMRSTAQSHAVKKVLMPMYKREIDALDEQESVELGTPKQFETRGRRLERKAILLEWMEWAGQGSEPPAKGE